MRAREFLAEKHIGKIGNRRQVATRGLHKFRDIGGYDRTYELNRVMMAVACSDGTTPLTLDTESWSGRYNTAHPYTDVEDAMIRQALKATGSEHQDLNHGNLDSEELSGVNVDSPVIGFKGYPR